MNSTIIDVIFIIFFVIMAIFGYIKGFITRLYDFIGTMIVLFLSFWLSKPISSIIILYHYDGTDIIANAIGSIINQIVVFFALLIILFIIKKVLGFVIKPLLESLSDKFALTSALNHILGVVLSLIESIVISYIVVVLMITPAYPQGKEMINQTIVAKHILDIVPSVTEKVQDMNTNIESLYNTKQSLESMTQLLLTAHQLGLVDDEQLLTMMKESVFDKLKNEEITLSLSDKDKVEDILKQSDYNNTIVKEILSNINVSDE